jgi:hypothetical protein
MPRVPRRPGTSPADFSRGSGITPTNPEATTAPEARQSCLACRAGPEHPRQTSPVAQGSGRPTPKQPPEARQSCLACRADRNFPGRPFQCSTIHANQPRSHNPRGEAVMPRVPRRPGTSPANLSHGSRITPTNPEATTAPEARQSCLACRADRKLPRQTSPMLQNYDD